ncbi:ribosomal RNA small subunit methyltransferase I [Marivirga tractuosa]|uniref:Ribosomal RNA small subunit methyltransferase I n=1 Tax=Marivirga tractuosa (strain ATCC 23168 / DSM 4126 / NBRC 15989 / NCIMB 1408 / VKM B-1430 / H-43) TaxID=643867 RepID=E4TTT3_MARTH|nr:16S rRNA (cytidine(1402)-2'-O)-methyltransferase [Marivirga tractuosa]ADR21988.1 Uroporphyrin-III C/tetrapyrrole (Corrin/Porphyrin) methyltransferase [Marivirga tractuosa DSM 4126]BDD13552.1 ribosomal RNA small subunit methyltransferase I [Marivirga tractuosa]
MEQSETQLYLVPTPIGNLADMTYRAVNILNSVDVILAEDTRTSGKLLKHYDIKKPLQSFHIHNEHKKVEQVIEELKAGRVMALISDAGTPGISDPGFLLAREALKNDIKLESLPGATALIPALIKSGFPNDRFIFEGFLPHKKGRKTRIENLQEEDRTIIFYESPHRLLKTLKQLAEVMGENRMASVSRELTKLYEETLTDTLKGLIEHFEKTAPKGEIVLVLNAKS